jgi:hypothetical protein
MSSGEELKSSDVFGDPIDGIGAGLGASQLEAPAIKEKDDGSEEGSKGTKKTSKKSVDKTSVNK